MERKIGKYAIRNLSLYIIIAYIVGYLLIFTGNVDFITLDPYEISQGQVWRILSWLFVPPAGFDFFTVIMLYFYYQLGTALERTWGAFRYNVYIFSGILFTIVGALALYFIVVYLNGGDAVVAQVAGKMIGESFNTSYINLSIFLAFAVTYPDMRILLFFVIPIRVKWMAIVYGVLLGWQFFQPGTGLAVRIAIVMSLLNFIVFFFATRNYKRISPQEMHRKREFKRATASAANMTSSPRSSAITKHKCAVCGRTEKDGDDLEFRFCSKCNGNYEYCNEHLFTHKHVE